MADAFSYFLPDGTPVNGSTTAPTPGTPYYQSAALNADKTKTDQGNALNAFQGFVSADGGSFGGGASADPMAARRAWESVSGVSGDKLGDTSGWDASKWDHMRKAFGGIANNDKATTLQALASDNPFLKETAQRYATNNGFLESATPTPNKVTPVPTAGAGLSDPGAAAGLTQNNPFLQKDPNAPDPRQAWVRQQQQNNYNSLVGRPSANQVNSAFGALSGGKNMPPSQSDPYAAFGGDTTPPPEQAVLSPRILTNSPPPPIVEGYRQFPGVQNVPTGGDTFPPPDAGPPGFSPPAPQSAWSGGQMAPSAGSGTRPSMSAGRFGRFQAFGASPFAQKFRQRFKPLGAPANGFTPQGGSAPSTQVF